MTTHSTPAFTYQAEAVALTTPDLPALKAAFLINHVPDGSVILDIGCGGGKMLRTIAASRVGTTLLGCDIRPPVQAPDDFEFSLLDPTGEELPYPPDSVDVVLLIDVLEHVSDPGAVLARVRRVLRNGGVVLAVVPTEGQPLGWYRLYRRLLGEDLYVRTKEHVQAFTHRDVDRLFSAGFDVVDQEYAYHFLGAFMDASICAALKLKAVHNLFWSSSPYHGDGTIPRSPVARWSARLISVANALAWLESRLLRRFRPGSATHLIAAAKQAATTTRSDAGQQ